MSQLRPNTVKLKKKGIRARDEGRQEKTMEMWKMK